MRNVRHKEVHHPVQGRVQAHDELELLQICLLFEHEVVRLNHDGAKPSDAEDDPHSHIRNSVHGNGGDL